MEAPVALVQNGRGNQVYPVAMMRERRERVERLLHGNTNLLRELAELDILLEGFDLERYISSRLASRNRANTTNWTER